MVIVVVALAEDDGSIVIKVFGVSLAVDEVFGVILAEGGFVFVNDRVGDWLVMTEGGRDQ
jgi:hypothetical protein